MAKRVYVQEEPEKQVVKLPKYVLVMNPKGREVWMPSEQYLRWKEANPLYDWVDDPKFDDLKNKFADEVKEKDIALQALKEELARLKMATFGDPNVAVPENVAVEPFSPADEVNGIEMVDIEGELEVKSSRKKR